MEWRERISVSPDVCHGRACVKGTRVMVSVIVDNVAEGEDWDSVASAYRIERDDVRAALAYAADLTRERVLALAPGAPA